MTATMSAQLVFRFDEEFPVRLLELCQLMAHSYARLPAFGHCISDHILDFLTSKVLELLGAHLVITDSRDTDPALGAGHLSHISVNYDGLCRDLAAVAFEHFTLAGHVKPPMAAL